jgi:glycosyltransferase involved in cell wall biosynthesis
MPPAELVTVDCSGVGPGGITRVLTEVVRHWPGRLELIAPPAGWDPPVDAPVVARPGGGRARSIAAAFRALRHANGSPVLSLSPSIAIRGVRPGRPVMTVVHDLAFRLWPHGLAASVRQYRRVSYATAIRRSDTLICVSARTQHDLLGLYGVPATRTRVWSLGSDLPDAPGAVPASLARPYLVIPGHAERKGVELAIEALADRPEYTLAVLTGGHRIDAFVRAAAESGASERIVFLDQLSDADYRATVGGAAAFLMPSHFEGFGLPAVEALQLGVPAVISPDPALHEATGGAAIQMTSWSGSALAQALDAIDHRPPPSTGGGRTWQEATEHLYALVVGATARPAAAPASR